METPISMESSKVVMIEVIRTETIKPLTPTPDHLKKFSMTVHDQFAPNINMPLVLFYPNSGEMSVADRNRRLKESLSKTLVRFYPVAGRINLEGAYVDCDDSGVEFIETKVNGFSLADILRCPDNEVLCKLLPCDGNTGGPRTLVRVQSNVFECGGIAVGTWFLHLAMDASGRSAFLNEWAALARGDSKQSPRPELDAIASRFPVVPNLGFMNLQKRNPLNTSLRRFVFDSDKITSLRDRTESASGVRPTRVGAVTAFIYKCMVNSLTTKLGHETRPSFAFQATNLRKMFNPPLPQTSLGNMVWFVFAESGDHNEFINDPASIIAQFKKGMRELTRDCATKMNDSTGILESCSEMGKFWRLQDRDSYFLSSLCGFGLNELDFGWGKPVWISIAGSYKNNVVRMMDAKGRGGIEAWITLNEEHMAFLETNAEFLEFASLNPPISLS